MTMKRHGPTRSNNSSNISNSSIPACTTPKCGAIAGAADYVGFLKINSKDFTRFDKQFLAHHADSSSDSPDYKYTAVPVGTGWSVIVDYVGPPASIPAPPLYEIELNKNKEFVDLKRRTH